MVLLSVLFGAALSLLSQQQPNALIAGTVFDENGRSLPGAAVAVASESGSEKERRSSTDRRGEFAIRVPAGRYVVTVSAKGFEAQERTVGVEVSERLTLNFLLSRQ